VVSTLDEPTGDGGQAGGTVPTGATLVTVERIFPVRGRVRNVTCLHDGGGNRVLAYG
jgi:hypothetical protein